MIRQSFLLLLKSVIIDQLKNFLIDKAEVDSNKAKMRAQQMFNAVYKKNIQNLGTNFRSYSEVVDFNNGFFSVIK